MTKEKLRIVFDCMIFLQAVMSEKSVAFKLFDYLDGNAFTLFVSRETLAEVNDVLFRPDIREMNLQITDEYVQAFLERVLLKTVLIKSVPQKFNYPRDQKDEKYVNLAVEAEADYIISRDKDLLDLMTDVSIEGKEFRQKFRPLKIVAPVEFLRIITEKI
ncbi:MAG: putative toxin-antitoxin system toxin component, PIN family [Acidobacteriota bacterium]|nr:putative toxin-antitoxin system toxin component, PIN family [Acidobacteriota bacterium]